MFISFFTGKVMLFYGISLIMKEKSNASALFAAASSTNGGREETTSQRGWENDGELPHTFYGTKKGAISLVREIAPIVSFLLCKKA